MGSGGVSGQITSLVRALCKLESQWVGPQHSWGPSAAPATVVAVALVLRIGLDSQEVGSADGPWQLSLSEIQACPPASHAWMALATSVNTSLLGLCSGPWEGRALCGETGRNIRNCDKRQSLVQSLPPSLPGACF